MVASPIRLERMLMGCMGCSVASIVWFRPDDVFAKGHVDDVEPED